MEKIFELIRVPTKEGHEGQAVRIGLRIHLGGQSSDCALTVPLNDLRGLSEEIGKIKAQLDGLVAEAEKFLPESFSSLSEGSEIKPEMSPEEVWSVLSKISEDETFMLRFNALSEERRRAVAEYVLTQCNIFSGRASFFSSLYDQQSSFMG